MGFDIALVNLAGGVLALDDGVGFGETGIEIAEAESEVVGNVGGVGGILIEPTTGTLSRVGQRGEALVDCRAPAAMASSAVRTAGNTSQSTSMRARASSARWAESAAMAATAWPR